MSNKKDDGYSVLEVRVNAGQISITDDYDHSQILMTHKCWHELKNTIDEKIKELNNV